MPSNCSWPQPHASLLPPARTAGPPGAGTWPPAAPRWGALSPSGPTPSSPRSVKPQPVSCGNCRQHSVHGPAPAAAQPLGSIGLLAPPPGPPWQWVTPGYLLLPNPGSSLPPSSLQDCKSSDGAVLSRQMATLPDLHGVYDPSRSPRSHSLPLAPCAVRSDLLTAVDRPGPRAVNPSICCSVCLWPPRDL